MLLCFCRMPVVHYRFKSGTLEWRVLHIDGPSVTVNELRAGIVAQEGLRHTFLLLSDHRSGLLLSGRIPAFSCVLVVRTPYQL